MGECASAFNVENVQFRFSNFNWFEIELNASHCMKCEPLKWRSNHKISFIPVSFHCTFMKHRPLIATANNMNYMNWTHRPSDTVTRWKIQWPTQTTIYYHLHTNFKKKKKQQQNDAAQRTQNVKWFDIFQPKVGHSIEMAIKQSKWIEKDVRIEKL